jgi:hypothetical protein
MGKSQEFEWLFKVVTAERAPVLAALASQTARHARNYHVFRS